MGESRTELLGWLNELLALNYTKVEQCGTGAAYCQVIDSIYGDVPMTKVKMLSKQQYEHLANYKVLQIVFKQKSIDKPIPVDKLVNCKMQDNLEFLQWLKKYWDLNYPGGEYDPIGRRKGLGGDPAPAGARAARSPVNAPAARTTTMAAKRAPAAAPPARVPAGVRPSSRTAAGVPDAALQALTAQMSEMKVSVEGLEKERDFYFNKLRDIEIIIGARLESGDETITEIEKEQLLQMQAILYSTEDGFEVPEGEGEEALEEEETF
ncbi:hypothetical protein RQP46_011359 [Phenoliferia psychrophenolica]